MILFSAYAEVNERYSICCTDDEVEVQSKGSYLPVGRHIKTELGQREAQT